MQIWYLDLDDMKQGPCLVVASDKDNYYISHPENTSWLFAVPKIVVLSTIEMEGEEESLIPSPKEYILIDSTITGIDFTYSDCIKTEH